MPLEPSVNLIQDLNEAWPTGTDTRREGDDHIRNVKKAVRSLLSNVDQIGIHHLEFILTAPSTVITTTKVGAVGRRLVVVIVQDSVGGRAITWGTMFVGAPTSLDTSPGAVNVFEFIGRSDGRWWLASPPLLGVS